MAIFFVPRHCISCCDDVFCAMALYFVPWQCSSCCNHVFGAAAKLFVLRRISSCCGKALCATAKLFVPWQSSLCRSNKMMHCGIVWHCSLCRGLCHGKKRCAVALHSIPCMKKGCCCVPQHVASCSTVILCAAAKSVLPW